MQKVQFTNGYTYYFAISNFARIENKALELGTQLRYDKQTCPFSHKSLVIQKGYIKSLIKVPLGTFIIKVFLNVAQYLYKFSAIVARHFATAQQSNQSNLLKEDFFNKNFNVNVYKSKFIISSAFLSCLIAKLGLQKYFTKLSLQ